MKTLFILRHAKSSWENPDLSDFDRPLNSRGLDAARFIGALIYEKKLRPQLILSSPAKRTKQTAVLVKEIAEIPRQVRFDERIYEASALTLFNLVSEMEESFESLLMIGHNPGLEGLVMTLTGTIQTMPTAALAKVSLNIDRWSEISSHCGKLEFLIRPKEEMEKSEININH